MSVRLRAGLSDSERARAVSLVRAAVRMPEWKLAGGGSYVVTGVPVLAEDLTGELAGATLTPGLIEGHSHILLHAYNETSWDDQVLREGLALRVARAVTHLRRTLAAGDLRTFEGGTGRRRRRQQPVAIAQHDLGVGADIDDQGHLVGEMRRLGQDHAGCIGADMARDAGQHEDTRVRMDFEIDLGGPDRDRPIGRERKGRTAELDRVNAEQQVMHDRIAD